MNRHTHVALLATLMSAAAWGQEVSVYGTTMAQMWKEDQPGFEKATFAPATQWLGIDANKLGNDHLSLHLFGWGQVDLKESTAFDDSKSRGYLSYGYLQYRFDQANAEIKAGRFNVGQTTGWEQIDGVSARTDLRGGFTVSGFVGAPGRFRFAHPTQQQNYNLQKDLIFGARLGWRMQKVGEIGVSYLQDGNKEAKDFNPAMPVNYARRQIGADIAIAPGSVFQLRGRTIFDVGDHTASVPGGPEKDSIAEHDYTAQVRIGSQWVLTGNFFERNFSTYFAGSNLHSLFNQDKNDRAKGYGAGATWTATAPLQVVVDYRHTERDLYGKNDRIGGEVRYTIGDRATLFGFGFHTVDVKDTVVVDPTAPAHSLNNNEFRLWAMTNLGKKFSLSLDGIYQGFEKDNPYLLGLSSLYEVVASLGYEINPNFKVSGDLAYGSTPYSKNETRGLLRAEYRFGKGGH